MWPLHLSFYVYSLLGMPHNLDAIKPFAIIIFNQIAQLAWNKQKNAFGKFVNIANDTAFSSQTQMNNYLCTLKRFSVNEIEDKKN